MTDITQYIKPERLGLWVAAAFILALLALVTASVGIMKYRTLALVSQTEVLLLNKKIEDMKNVTSQAAPVAAPMVKNEGK